MLSFLRLAHHVTRPSVKRTWTYVSHHETFGEWNVEMTQAKFTNYQPHLGVKRLAQIQQLIFRGQLFSPKVGFDIIILNEIFSMLEKIVQGLNWDENVKRDFDLRMLMTLCIQACIVTCHRYQINTTWPLRIHYLFLG